MEKQTCNICGGSANMRYLKSKGHDAHILCVERKKLDLPTPSLGEECPECLGMKCRPKSAFGPMLFATGNTPASAARAIDAWAPKCKTCDGKGYVS